METEIIADEPYGAESYKALFEEIMLDIGKAALIENTVLVLKPEVPLFIFSIKLRAQPADRTITDVSNVRSEGDSIHITITDERYAPVLLDELWKRYGRESVHQQTRFDMDVDNAKEEDVKGMIIASGAEFMKEIVGSIWRSMPEGIKNRHTFIDGTVITVAATEERMEPFMLEEAGTIHDRMRGV